jgi:hypothetical protein
MRNFTKWTQIFYALDSSPCPICPQRQSLKLAFSVRATPTTIIGHSFMLAGQGLINPIPSRVRKVTVHLRPTAAQT